ncbi:uncharacterized protein LOC125029051 [Penaeus chinensis]|uniref:uncharacterized protein LOC125029051 n=1 Tax=Penaeus chinensis TaxID=139456 RepID=UPI001FB57E59|nr:uncharacterized protein LOC125029051 [Penaeus chinensis]
MVYTAIFCLLLECVTVSLGKSLPMLRKDGKSEGSLHSPSTTEGYTAPQQPKEKSTPWNLVPNSSASDYGKTIGPQNVIFPVPLMTPEISDKGRIFPSIPGIPPLWDAAQYPTSEKVFTPLPNILQDPMTVGNMPEFRAAKENIPQVPEPIWNTAQNPFYKVSMPPGFLNETQEATTPHVPSVLKVDLGHTTQLPEMEPQDSATQGGVKKTPIAIELTPNVKLDRLEVKANKVILHGYPCQCPPGVPCYCPIDL